MFLIKAFSTVKVNFMSNPDFRFLCHDTYRGSYMSAHVLLNSLNALGKRDKMRGLCGLLSQRV